MAITSPSINRTQEILILAVPFSEKDEARAQGARWSTERKVWFIHAGRDVGPFAKWLPQPVDTAAQSNRKCRSRVDLYVDMVPKSAWYSNLRSEVTGAEWELLKRKTFEAAGGCCEACDERGSHRPVECHERWTFDEKTRVQTLDRTIAFCPDCHEATHYGLAEKRGRANEAKLQLMKVTGMSPAQVQQHLHAAGETWRRRSKMTWTLDARWLLDYIPLSDATRTKLLAHAINAIDRFAPAAGDGEDSSLRPRQRG